MIIYILTYFYNNLRCTQKLVELIRKVLLLRQRLSINQSAYNLVFTKKEYL
jgi:hypothetical protein